MRCEWVLKNQEQCSLEAVFNGNFCVYHSAKPQFLLDINNRSEFQFSGLKNKKNSYLKKHPNAFQSLVGKPKKKKVEKVRRVYKYNPDDYIDPNFTPMTDEEWFKLKRGKNS